MQTRGQQVFNPMPPGSASVQVSVPCAGGAGPKPMWHSKTVCCAPATAASPSCWCRWWLQIYYSQCCAASRRRAFKRKSRIRHRVAHRIGSGDEQRGSFRCFRLHRARISVIHRCGEVRVICVACGIGDAAQIWYCQTGLGELFS